MNFLQAIASCLRNYAVFHGRASRSEYWYWYLAAIPCLIGLRLIPVDLYAPGGPETRIGLSIISLALTVPTFAVTARRLHDADRTGWLSLALFVPALNILFAILFGMQDGTAGPNRHGEDPLGRLPVGGTTDTPATGKAPYRRPELNRALAQAAKLGGPAEQAFRDAVAAQGEAATDAGHLLSVLRASYRIALDWDKAADDPAQGAAMLEAAGLDVLRTTGYWYLSENSASLHAGRLADPEMQDLMSRLQKRDPREDEQVRAVVRDWCAQRDAQAVPV